MLFYTVVFAEDGVQSDQQVHGPFFNERERQASASEMVDTYDDDVYICMVDALMDDGEVNLVIPE